MTSEDVAFLLMFAGLTLVSAAVLWIVHPALAGLAVGIFIGRVREVHRLQRR